MEKLKINIDRGYISKPKYIKGYKIKRYYCECGCKQCYWHYVKLKSMRTK